MYDIYSIYLSFRRLLIYLNNGMSSFLSVCCILYSHCQLNSSRSWAFLESKTLRCNVPRLSVHSVGLRSKSAVSTIHWNRGSSLTLFSPAFLQLSYISKSWHINWWRFKDEHSKRHGLETIIKDKKTSDKNLVKVFVSIYKSLNYNELIYVMSVSKPETKFIQVVTQL
jgi:hypothetical protein